MTLLRQFLIFCGVGLVNTAAGYGVIAALTLATAWHYAFNNMLGYAAGLCVAFVLHRNVTFRAAAGQQAARDQIMPFLALFAICYVIQLAALWLLISQWTLPELLAQLLAVGLYAILNFLGSRFFVFRAKSG